MSQRLLVGGNATSTLEVMGTPDTPRCSTSYKFVAFAATLQTTVKHRIVMRFGQLGDTVSLAGHPVQDRWPYYCALLQLDWITSSGCPRTHIINSRRTYKLNIVVNICRSIRHSICKRLIEVSGLLEKRIGVVSKDWKFGE